MGQRIELIQILIKKEHPQALILGKEIKDWLENKGVQCQLLDKNEHNGLKDCGQSCPDFILVLGGDGTILRVAHFLKNYQVPILGLNLGQVGFLTDLEPCDWSRDLSRVLDGKYTLSPKIMLQYQVKRQGNFLNQGKVVNELVLGRGGRARLITLSLYFQGKEFGTFRADGIIVSTPVGATAYAYASGGPLISPELEVMEICPICPFLSKIRPMVLPSSGKIEIKIEPPGTDLYLTLDGQSSFCLSPGDSIEIQEARERLYFLKPESDNYLQKLKRKGYI